MSIKNLVSFLEDKKILILGFGREGKSSYVFLRKYFPEKKITISDRNTVTIDDKNVETISGEGYLDCLGDFDVVLKSPGIAFLDVKYPPTTFVTCQLDLFLRFCDCKTIGITGTKGKTTTSTLIFDFLRQAGYNCCLIGNIGIPVFEDLDDNKDKICVIEMSSHQLEFTTSSPDVAVVTNIYQEHLDHYKDGFSGYVNAKMNIVKHQGVNGKFVYNGEQGLDDYLDFSSVKSTAVGVLFDEKKADELIDHNKNLLGNHNKMDVLMAREAVKTFGVDDECIKQALKKYEGIPNRMEFFGTYNGVDYYNDSIATIPKSVMCAVSAIENVSTLIIGGLDRGIDYTEFENFLCESSLDLIICLPETGHKIYDELEKSGCKVKMKKVRDLPEGVSVAARETKKGRAVLLSPAAASYNVYRDFEEKGNHFKQLVRNFN